MKGNSLSTENPDETLKCHISISLWKGNKIYAIFPGKMRLSQFESLF